MATNTAMKWLLSSLLFLACACGAEEKTKDEEDEQEGQSFAYTCDVVVSDETCDKSLRPIVFVHGTLGSGDQFAHPAMLFGSNGYCQDRIVAVEYNSVDLLNPNRDIGPAIDAVVDEILAKTGQTQVELVGHSQGTGHCVAYLEDPARAAKVAHYINISGRTTIPVGVKALSLSSTNDLGGETHHAPGAELEVTMTMGEDHVDIASSPSAFVEMYRYLMGRDPQYTDVQCGDEQVTIEGLAETLGDNIPVTDGRIEVYEMGDSPRERGAPILTITPQAGGRAAPFTLQRGRQYEFKAIDGQDKLIGHVYFAPFKRSNRLVRFVSFSSNPLVSGVSTDPLKRGPHHVTIVARFLRGSFRRDLGQTLTINGAEILTDQVAGRETTTVGLFMSDQDEDGQTDLGVSYSFPFLFATDVFVDAREPAWIDLVTNGTTMKIPNWPSNEGLISLNLP